MSGQFLSPIIDASQFLRQYAAGELSKQVRQRSEFSPCVKCGRRLQEGRTGRHPFGGEDVCDECQDVAGNEFCEALSEYVASPDENAQSLEDMIQVLKAREESLQTH